MSSRTSQRRLPPAWLLPWGAFAAIVVTWLLDVAGPGVPEPLARAVLIVGLAALLGAAGRAVLGSVRRRGVTGWALLAVTALSLGMKLSTLDFELTTHARNDEGVYREFAEKINEGELLPRYFNYGHLLYYAGALSLWAGEQFPETSALAAEGLYGARTPLEVRRVLLRLITALLAALTVIPVFLAAERLGGPWAGVVGGLLLAASTVHNEVAPQFTADGPSGFFAALAFLYVVKLVEGERLADYLAAGALAGLAAACKYPGGVVTVGIFGVWLFWRVRLRRFSWSLVWAAAACVGALLVVMPALWLTPGAVLDPSQTDGRDLFFGVRQYAFGGWLGVEPESVTLWNLRVLRADLGWPAILFGIGGWFLLDPDRRRRLLVALVFPAAYLALLFAMNMVVRRNLLPVLPAVAAVLAVGIAAWPALLARRSRRWRTAAATGVALAALAYPLFAATAVTVRRNRPSTGELAVQWIRAHVPEGAAFLREDYTPALRRELYPQVHRRFAARMSLAEIRDPAWDYLLLSHSAYGRFLDPALWSQPHHQEFARRYEAMFGFDLVREFTPGWFRAGPLLRLYRLDPEEIDYRRKRLFAADRADWVSDPQIREAPRPRRLRYTRRWQYALFKEYFDAGAYRARIEYRPREAEGYLHVVSREGREVGTFPMGPEVRLDLPEPGKYFFKVFLAPPTELFGLLVEPAE